MPLNHPLLARGKCSDRTI